MALQMCPIQNPRFECGAPHSQNSCYVKISLISKNKPTASSEGYLSALGVLDPEWGMDWEFSLRTLASEPLSRKRSEGRAAHGKHWSRSHCLLQRMKIMSDFSLMLTSQLSVAMCRRGSPRFSLSQGALTLPTSQERAGMCFFLELLWEPLFVTETGKDSGACSVLMLTSCFCF